MLSVKLFYYDDITPVNYQPSFFEDSTNSPALPFTSVPETVMCGKIYSLDHGIGLKMHLPSTDVEGEACRAASPHSSSVTDASRTADHLDLLEDGSGYIPRLNESDMDDLETSLCQMSTLSAAERAVDREMDESEQHCAREERIEQAQQTQAQQPPPDDGSATAAPHMDEKAFENVHTYIVRMNKAVMKECAAEFPIYSQMLLRQVFTQLVEADVIVKLANGSYRMCKPTISDEHVAESSFAFNTAIVTLFGTSAPPSPPPPPLHTNPKPPPYHSTCIHSLCFCHPFFTSSHDRPRHSRRDYDNDA